MIRSKVNSGEDKINTDKLRMAVIQIESVMAALMHSSILDDGQMYEKLSIALSIILSELPECSEKFILKKTFQ